MEWGSFLSTCTEAVAGYCPTMPTVLSRSRRCKAQKKGGGGQKGGWLGGGQGGGREKGRQFSDTTFDDWFISFCFEREGEWW